MDEQRIIDLEIKIAHQELLLSDLNQVITKQQTTIDELQSALKGFLKRYQELHGDDGIGAPEITKPPHY
jgi:SlyX protein